MLRRKIAHIVFVADDFVFFPYLIQKYPLIRNRLIVVEDLNYRERRERVSDCR